MQARTFNTAMNMAVFKPARFDLNGVLRQISDIFAAVGEGIRASDRYCDLTSEGVPANVAVRKAFDHVWNEIHNS